jgi:hypothetical protein
MLRFAGIADICLPIDLLFPAIQAFPSEHRSPVILRKVGRPIIKLLQKLPEFVTFDDVFQYALILVGDEYLFERNVQSLTLVNSVEFGDSAFLAAMLNN